VAEVLSLGNVRSGDSALQLRDSFATMLRHFRQARTGTEAVRSSLPQLTHAPFTPRKIAFQMQ
jgi:hypothetical protein